MYGEPCCEDIVITTCVWLQDESSKGQTSGPGTPSHAVEERPTASLQSTPVGTEGQPPQDTEELFGPKVAVGAHQSPPQAVMASETAASPPMEVQWNPVYSGHLGPEIYGCT